MTFETNRTTVTSVREYSSSCAGTIQSQPATLVQISTKNSAGRIRRARLS